MGCCKCTVPQKKMWLWGCSVFWMLFALILGLIWPTLSTKMLYDQLMLKQGSMTYDNWIETPIPMYAEFFMFNWTNPEDIRNTSIKPHFVEMGPYVFAEVHTRNDVQFFDNNTVAFNQTRRWTFVPEKSNGSLDDMITNVNAIVLTVAYSTRYLGKIVDIVINNLLRFTGEHLLVTKPVRELLFEGYEDPVLNILKKLKLKQFDIPYDKFGWFVDRNGSSSYDGRFHMNTGQDDIKKMGMVDLWNFQDHTNAYKGDCGRVKGTTGEIWPPADRFSPATMFISDICRPLTLKHAGEIEKHKIRAEKFVADESVLDNGWSYPENMCYCTADSCPDLLPGVMNVSECKMGAPAFISFPHFYLASPNYRDAVSGLNPNKEDHEFYMSIERSTGIPLEARAGLQINMLIDDYPNLGVMAGLPKKFIPVFWFRQAVDLSEDLAGQVWWAVKLPSLGVWVAYGLAGVAFLTMCVGIYLSAFKKWGETPADGQDDELLR